MPPRAKAIALATATLRTIRTRKNELGMSLRELAENMDCSHMTVQRLLSGDASIDLVSLSQLCDALSLQLEVKITP